MKKEVILIVIFIFSAWRIAYAQEHQFFAIQGSLESATTNYSGLNKALELFNQENGSDFKKLVAGFGFDAALSRIWDDNGIYAGLRYTQLNAQSKSDLANGEGLVKAQQNLLGIESGFSIIQNNHLEIQLGFSADWRLEKVSVNNGIETVEAIGELNGSISPHFQAYFFLSRKIPLAAFGRVYFAWSFTETDYSRVYNKLHEEQTSLNSDELMSRPNVFGISVGLALVFHQRDLSFTRSSKPTN